MAEEQDRRLAETMARERPRLRNFIRARLDDEAEADDIIEEAFAELLEATRLMKPIEQAGAWLFRVVRNRIIDRFRRKKPDASLDQKFPGDEDGLTLEDLLPSPDAGPDAAYARQVLLEELEDALDELPAEQRDVFVANELDGKTFVEIERETGVKINTLLSRKRYAILHLRERLREIYEELGGD